MHAVVSFSTLCTVQGARVDVKASVSTPSPYVPALPQRGAARIFHSPPFPAPKASLFFGSSRCLCEHVGAYASMRMCERTRF